MNNTISKKRLRGKPLKPFCKNAHMSKYKHGDDNVIIFCYGTYKNDWKIEATCLKCKAFVDNVMQSK